MNMRYDVEVSFEITGENGFGESETLQASRVITVKANCEKQAKDFALNEAKNQGLTPTNAVAVLFR